MRQIQSLLNQCFTTFLLLPPSTILMPLDFASLMTLWIAIGSFFFHGSQFFNRLFNLNLFMFCHRPYINLESFPGRSDTRRAGAYYPTNKDSKPWKFPTNGQSGWNFDIKKYLFSSLFYCFLYNHISLYPDRIFLTFIFSVKNPRLSMNGEEGIYREFIGFGIGGKSGRFCMLSRIWNSNWR